LVTLVVIGKRSEAVLVNEVLIPLDGIGFHNLVSQLIKKPGGTHAPGAGCFDATP